MSSHGTVRITHHVMTRREARCFASGLNLSDWSVVPSPSTCLPPAPNAPIWAIEVAVSQGNAMALWSALGGVGATGRDFNQIDQDWLVFRRGTDRDYIWRWLEDRFDTSTADLMCG